MASSEEAEHIPKKMKLYSDWLSSCSWRVRITLNLKGLEYEYHGVDIIKGDQYSPEFMKLNPLGYVPVLVDGDVVIADSTAIILYLEDKYPQPSLLPQLDNFQKRALNYQVANIVAANIQPFQNYAVMNYIEDKLGSDEKISWAIHHIKKGFTALETLLKDQAGTYATGDEVSLSDMYLAPQIYGAIKRFKIDMNEFPVLKRLNDSSYSQIKAFQDAAPEKQPDAPDDVASHC